MKLYDEFIQDTDFEQIFSFDFKEEKIQELESEIALAKVELKMAHEKVDMWKSMYEDMKESFFNILGDKKYV